LPGRASPGACARLAVSPPVLWPGAGAAGRPWETSGPGAESGHGEGEWDRVGAALQAGAGELVVCA